MASSIIRTIIIYFLITTALRVMGKRQIGELSSAEFVITMLFSELAAIPIENLNIPLIHAVVPILMLLALEILVSLVFLKNRRLRKFAVGRTSIIINGGKINQKEMKRLRFTIDELLEELRLKGFIDISEVKYAILETNGELSVFPFGEAQAATRKDIGLKDDNMQLPYTIIADGILIKNEAERLGITDNRINKELSKMGIHSYEEVFLMQADEKKKFFIIPKEKRPK